MQEPVQLVEGSLQLGIHAGPHSMYSALGGHVAVGPERQRDQSPGENGIKKRMKEYNIQIFYTDKDCSVLRGVLAVVGLGVVGPTVGGLGVVGPTVGGLGVVGPGVGGAGVVGSGVGCDNYSTFNSFPVLVCSFRNKHLQT